MSKLRLFFDLEILSSATSTKLQREPQTAMAKEKSADKEERKKEKKASKEKRSETNGVHKTKSDKKDKKQKKIAAAAGDQAVTTKLLNALEEDKPGSVAVKEEGDIEVKVKAAPLLGALVPFANPLADDKVGKKLLKTVKKCKEAAICSYIDAKTIGWQLQSKRPSSAVSKKSSKLCGSPQPPPPAIHLIVSSLLQQISRPWTSFLTSRSSAKTTNYHISLSPRGRSWGLREVRRGLRAW